MNWIKAIFSGIFGFIGGLFGGKKAAMDNAPKVKKGNGYFLELDEAKSVSATPAASASASTAKQPMTADPTAIAKTATPAAAANGKKTSRKEKLAALAAANNATAPTNAEPTTPEPQPTPVVTTTPVPDTAFATKYLIPSNNGGRRRPGANMSTYLDMARSMSSSR